MNSEQLIWLEQELGADIYHPLNIVLERGLGVWVWDVEGNKYLDCLSAYSTVSQGHCHPKILAAMSAQAEKLTLTSRAFRNDQLALFYKDLTELTGYDMVLPMNSGAEAVETAIKLARKWGYKKKRVPVGSAEIVVMDDNFHGRTTTIVGFSSTPQYRDLFGPYGEGFVSVPFGDIEALAEAVNRNTVGVLLEPIQGETGVIIPPQGYLSEVRELCDEFGVLMIDDEIQTGLGRTGKMFAVDHEQVRPDIMILGKALSGGFYPVSAVVADRPILGVLKPGDHGSTFGGNPLGAAVSRAAMMALVNEGMVENSAVMGERFLRGLEGIANDKVADIRGRGLFIALELLPEAGTAREFCEKLARRGVLAKETHGQIVRFAPPLVIEAETIDWAVEQIKIVLQS